MYGWVPCKSSDSGRDSASPYPEVQSSKYTLFSLRVGPLPRELINPHRITGLMYIVQYDLRYIGSCLPPPTFHMNLEMYSGHFGLPLCSLFCKSCVTQLRCFQNLVSFLTNIVFYFIDLMLCSRGPEKEIKPNPEPPPHKYFWLR